jgi:hypothetical protein
MDTIWSTSNTIQDHIQHYISNSAVIDAHKAEEEAAATAKERDAAAEWARDALKARLGRQRRS